MDPRNESFVSDYLSAVRACWTKNGINQIHKQLEGTLAPAEMSSLASPLVLARAPNRSLEWLQRIRGLSSTLFITPAPFQRQPLAQDVTLFADPRVPAENKELILAFAGKSNRLLMPIAVFLQALNAEAWDLVLVQKGKPPLQEGIEGVAADFGGALAYVEELARPHRYRGLVTLGTSSGGYVAILAAFHLGARRGISISGSLLRRIAAFEPPVAARDSAAASDLIYVHGAEFAPDRDAAEAMRACWGGRCEAVPDANAHNALRPLLERGALSIYHRDLLH